MSHALIARNSDLGRLQKDGYALRIVDGAYLLTENVPYVTTDRAVQEGTLVMELTLAGDLTVPPPRHVAHWIGEFPCDSSGNKLLPLILENQTRGSISDSLPPAYQLSAKPDTPYRDYHHKVTTYVEILGREARHITPDATAQQWRIIADQDDPESVFLFADTASARQNTVDLARKLASERIAIVGVGGTGSYVLDFVAKTWGTCHRSFRRRPVSPAQRLPLTRFLLPARTRRRSCQIGIPCRAIFHHAQASHRPQHAHRRYQRGPTRSIRYGIPLHRRASDQGSDP